MKSRIELDVNVPQAQLAELFADPRQNPSWMEELDHIEPLSGTLGQPGSTYRMVPKDGKEAFVAEVLARDLPNEARLVLDSSTVSVAVTDRFIPLSERTTKLVSEEVFVFRGLVAKATGLFAAPAIHRAHRKHMESFKRFAEAAVGSGTTH